LSFEIVCSQGTRADVNESTAGHCKARTFARRQNKAVFNLQGDDGTKPGGLAVDSNLGRKGPEAYVATAPQVLDLWQGPQERYDVFMNNFAERTWTLVTINAATKDLMQARVKYLPRKLQRTSLALACQAIERRSLNGPENRGRSLFSTPARKGQGR
jgi:hypothetical protein